MHFSDYPIPALMTIAKRPELVFTRGQGAWLYDSENKRYLDFIQGWAVNCLGHCHATMINALTTQAQRLINPGPAFYNAPMAELASLLTRLSCFQKVFFANSGAEANEGAIKLARKWGRKFKNGAHEIITFNHSFHGRTLATMSASGKAGWDTMYAPQVAGFPKAELNDIASVERCIHSKTVAVMLEPIQGEAGVLGATREFMQQLRALTQKHNLLLIVDEVQTGCGRTGQLFAYQWSEIEPDIMTLGKGIGGGVPLAALLARDEVACFEAGEQGGTYNGNPLMCAVGVAVLEHISKAEFLASVRERATYFSHVLLKVSNDYGLAGERGAGLLRALLLSKEIGHEIVETARELNPEGLLLNAARPNLLRFMPALNVSEDEIDLMLAMLRKVLDKLA
ncbi:acetylornithine aminotransferase protein [Mycoavidus cysteinexigens]|uniref:Acetylornithine aminotransferase n=1 Tax=Mycoavidus cysteinexigens TaxID=1553431 RepID=A0A2Z6ESZ4_9BURK|nr:acetylornithine transaminase [Mycoavidus cysteinexigens]BBE08533.1 acetylornithine aminotransferase protein [Mycoavidus cysteinexigens]GAM52764.1 acetylornithine aminotransferase [bacterium endosymbiont of Mortierella elongata FMR23-6]GLR01000.1 acetylornithine aminotransferase [Mycoavidus cysteinexigens]